MTKYLHPTGHFDRSRWRRRSNEVIQQVFAENPELVEDPTRHKELRKLVSAAYPFGPRKQLPYKAWCSAVRDAFYKLATSNRAATAPLHRRCDACGAKPGVMCHPIGPDPVAQHEMVLQDAILEGRCAEDIERLRKSFPLHASRTPPPPTLPLFEGL